MLSLQSCAMRLLDWVTPNSGYSVANDLAFGPLERQRLDQYRALENRQNTTVIFWYGGSWEEGSKNNYRFVAQALSSAGYDVVVPDYRGYPEVLLDDTIADAALATQWTLDNTEQPVVLMGHSAGAHLAAMIALNGDYLAQLNADASRIKALVGWSGPYDFLPLKSSKLKDIFSPFDAQPELSQPVHYAGPAAPPTLLIHGLDDDLVSPNNSRSLEKSLRENQVLVSSHYYDGVGHAAVVAAVSPRLGKSTNTLADTIAFLQSLP